MQEAKSLAVRDAEETDGTANRGGRGKRGRGRGRGRSRGRVDRTEAGPVPGDMRPADSTGAQDSDAEEQGG